MTARPLHHHEDLRRLLAPRSIAIVGVSERAGSFGRNTRENLVNFAGRLYLINPKGGQIGAETAYTELAALPEVPDCVLLALPREGVLPVLREAARLGVGGAVVFASGFAETGQAAHGGLQREMAELAATSGLRILGPNCLGLVNHRHAMRATFLTCDLPPQLDEHAVGIVSQSGALGHALGQAMQRGVSVSHILTPGNSVDVDVADLTAYLVESGGCRAVACLVEGMAEPLRLVQAARRARERGKPLVVLKIAQGEDGAQAAASHTGSLAGTHAVYRAALEREGAVVVDDFEALLETACFFAKAPEPARLTGGGVGGGVAVIATSGGAAIMAADQAEAHGVPMPQPGAAAHAVLAAHIPEFGSTRNPCDVTGQVMGNPESLRACAVALLDDPAFDVLLVPQPYVYPTTLERFRALGQAARERGKLVCNVWITEWLEGQGAVESERNPHVALFRSMRRCYAALAAWRRRAARIARWEAARLAAPATGDDAARARALIAAHPTAVITESAAKTILACYGVPVVAEARVTTAAAAREAARALDLPVAMKIESPDIPHKTELGLVKLGLGSLDAVAEAFDALMERARAAEPTPRIEGVLVQAMAPRGLEIMVGARVDPQFGPLVVVGLGGVLVELLADTAVLPAPVSPAEAEDMLRGLKGARLLGGFRDQGAVDLPRLARAVAAVSRLAADQADLLGELDVNPLVCSGNALVAVDALMLRAPR